MADSPQDRKTLAFKAPPAVKAWLEREARSGYRSVSAQVLLLIEDAMRQSLAKEASE